jgi:hypothetical protein
VDRPEARPILVTGMARSGTTWVGRMLCAGGAAGYVHEPFNLTRMPGTLRLPARHWYEYVCADNEELFLPRLHAWLRFRYPLAREVARCRSRAELRWTVDMWRSFRASRGRRPLAKAPHAVFSAEWFADRLGGDVVVTVRHPAAVVASWKRLGWPFDFGNLLDQPLLVRDHLGSVVQELEAARAAEPNLVDQVALLWRVIYSAVSDYSARRPAFRIVRQEDLSRNPVGEFRRLYEAVGLPFTSEAAEAVTRSSAPTNPKETTTEDPYETQLDSAATLETWRSRLTADERARIREITETTARRYYPEIEW